MTFLITLAKGSITADLTNCNTNVTKILVNAAPPIVTPTTTADTKPNEIPINIGLLSNQYQLTFDLKDGIEDWTAASTTNFGKLFYMARFKSPDVLTFTWGPVVTTVIIAGLRMGTQAGKKDLLEGCSMTLQESMVITF